MTATSKTRTGANTNSASGIDTLSRVSLISMGVASGLIGLWAAACVVGAVVSNGPAAMVRGFFSALVG
jgi:hypothetical protein